MMSRHLPCSESVCGRSWGGVCSGCGVALRCGYGAGSNAGVWMLGVRLVHIMPCCYHLAFTAKALRSGKEHMYTA
jgi:hypothetical protein